MSGLFSGLRIGLKTLSNLETAISVVNENITNVNTPGYSRKRVSFKSFGSEVQPYGAVGGGADLERIESIRNRFLEKRILTEFQSKGTLSGQHFGLQQIESILYNSGQSQISDQLSRFFNSFLELSADPSSLPLRQAVLSEGSKLTDAMKNASQKIMALEVENRTQIKNSVDRVNTILEQIGRLNLQIAPSIRQGQDAAALYDERQQLTNQLAEEVGLVAYESESGVQTISTTHGRLLLSGNQVFKLEFGETNTGVSIKHLSQEITSEIRTGKLGGYLEMAAQVYPSYANALDTLARELAGEVNTLHKTGVGLDGTTGKDLFTYASTDPAGTLAVAFTDPRTLAARASGAGPGDSSIAQQIADLRDKKLTNLGDDTLTGYFSNLVFQAGLDSRQVKDNLTTQEKIMEQLQNQRDSVSGVSLDEEAVNLLQYQRAYQATARFIRVVDELLAETMDLIR